jgi:hypothetical protein
MISPKTRRAGVILLDALILFFAIVTLLILDTGGGTVRVAGLKITTYTIWRPLAWAVGLFVLRLALFRSTGIFGYSRDQLARGLGLRERLATAVSGPLPGWREVLVVTLGIAAVMAIVLHEQLASFYLVPDLGDPLFSMWRMGWVAHQVLASPPHLFDGNIFHPEPGTLTYSDSMLLPSLMGAPLVWLGLPIAIVYTLVFLASFLLSGVATYCLARVLALPRGAAWIAALIFALCQYRIEHYSHLELQVAQWMPLTLLAAHRWLATGRARYAVYLALALGGQWYSSMYYGVFLTIYAGVFICVLALAWRAGWTRWAVACACLLVGVGLAWPLARAYKATEAARGTRNTEVVEFYSALPSDYLAPNLRSLYRGHLAVGGAERDLFPHFTPLGLAAVGLVPPLGAAELALLASGLTAFDGSMGFNGRWYRFAYDHLGPLKSMRVPARFAILVNLSLALFAGVGTARLLRRVKRPTVRRIVLVAVTGLFVLESMPDLRLRPVWKTAPSLYASLGPASGAVLFEYPIRRNDNGDNFAYIYFSTWHWTPTVNGYSGFTPQSYVDLAERTAGFPLDGTVAYLQQRGVTHVSLHCAFWDDEACALTVDRIAADPRLRMVTRTQWEGKPAYLYELSK